MNGDGSEYGPCVHGSCGPRLQRATGAFGELVVVVVLGAMLTEIEVFGPGLWLALSLFVVIRPTATLLALSQSPLSRPQRAFIGWFGVRGVGSIYYLAYALSHGVSGPAARTLADITLVVVAGSIVLHGVSVTPLMQRYSMLIGEDRRTHE